jgi:hypothetical protein
MQKKYVHCNKCGCECYWDTNRNGKRYLAQRNVQEYEGGTGTWKSPHYCTATPEEAAEYQASIQRWKDEQARSDAKALADGEIIVGQTVKVRRGRKVPIGIIGIVFWVADEADNFDVWKIGIKTEAGDKHFLAQNNVEFYFDGADELYESRVAAEKAEAKERRKARKAFIASGEEEEF